MSARVRQRNYNNHRNETTIDRLKKNKVVLWIAILFCIYMNYLSWSFCFKMYKLTHPPQYHHWYKNNKRCLFVSGVDFFGMDLNRPILHVNSPEACCDKCDRNENCKAWGWNDGSIDLQYKNMCFLKKGISPNNSRLNDAVTSGVKCESNSDMKTFCYSLNSMMLAKYDKIGDMQLKLSRLLNK